MKSRSTMRDVAQAAGVSLGTVSRVLNGYKHVTPEMHERVMEAMQSLGYRPNGVARSMRTRTTRTIGFLIVDVSNPLFGSIVKAAEEVLYAAGYMLILANTNDRAAHESDIVALFQERQVDGLIMTVSAESDQALIDSLAQLSVPVVLLDREMPLPFDSVLVDHARGMYQATQYLLGLGHRDIALITTSTAIRAGRERIRGFTQAYLDRGLQPDPRLILSGSLSSEYGYRESYALLSRATPPTAIIAGGNQIFIGVLKAARQIGVDIPAQLSLVSCDDTDLTALAKPSITVINRDLEEIGRTAAELLLRRMNDQAQENPAHVLLATEVVLRESCAPPVAARLDRPPHTDGTAA